MKKRVCIVSNLVLICWYFLDMIGVSGDNNYLVTQSYKEDWIFMVIPLLALILFIIYEKIGKYILIGWLSMWFITQFLSHEGYTIFGNGFMGSKEEKLEYFKGSIKFIESETVYIPDVYHVILHILIMTALVTTILYCAAKRAKD